MTRASRLALILALGASSAVARQLRVPGDYSRIQAAIDAARNGDDIVIAPGTYDEYGVDFKGKAIEVRASDARPWQTVVRADKRGSVFMFHSGEGDDSVLQGLTITEGSSWAGAGIFIEGMAASPLIRNCTIVGNDADNYGGGIYVASSAPAITSCVIYDNTAVRGGGVYVGSIGYPDVTNCTIADNAASGRGGGINIYRGDPDIRNSIIWGNSPQALYNDGGSSSVTYSDIQGGWSGEGNINEDPRFRGFRAYGYVLNVGSPCMDAGSDEADALPWGEIHARYGQFNSSKADMGVYGGPNAGPWQK